MCKTQNDFLNALLSFHNNKDELIVESGSRLVDKKNPGAHQTVEFQTRVKWMTALVKHTSMTKRLKNLQANFECVYTKILNSYFQKFNFRGRSD